MARFVLLRHFLPDGSGNEDHFDLMIENPDLAADEHSLTTWHLSSWPVTSQQTVRQLPPHRVAWLDLVGPVSGGRGFVKRVCRGQCVVVSRTPDCWIVRFQTIDLVPVDPTIADAWPGTQKEVELVFESDGVSNSADGWRISVR